MIDDEEGWLELLDSRNLLVHTYSEEQVMSVIDDVKSTYLALFDFLKAELEDHWDCRVEESERTI